MDGILNALDPYRENLVTAEMAIFVNPDGTSGNLAAMPLLIMPFEFWPASTCVLNMASRGSRNGCENHFIFYFGDLLSANAED